jgi:hypothetical protein
VGECDIDDLAVVVDGDDGGRELGSHGLDGRRESVHGSSSLVGRMIVIRVCAVRGSDFEERVDSLHRAGVNGSVVRAVG